CTSAHSFFSYIYPTPPRPTLFPYTTLFRSATGQIRQFCNKAVWVQYGEMKQFGDMKDVVKNYAEFVSQYKNLSHDEQIEYKDKMVEEQMEKSQKLKLPKEHINMSDLAISGVLFLFMLFGIFFQIYSL